MKYILLSIALLAPRILHASDASGLEASALLPTCEKCGFKDAAPLGLRIATTVSDLATAANNLSATNTKVAPVRSTSSTLPGRPTAHVKLPGRDEMAGFYVAPCLFVTAGHQRDDNGTYKTIHASNEFDVNGNPTNYRELELVKVAQGSDAVLYRDKVCAGGSAGYFELDAIEDPSEVVLFGLNGNSSPKCSTTSVRGKELFHNCISAPGDSGGVIASVASFESPQLGRTGSPIWSALGMHTGRRGGQKVAVSAGAIWEFAGREINADIRDYLEKKNLISSTRSNEYFVSDN